MEAKGKRPALFWSQLNSNGLNGPQWNGEATGKRTSAVHGELLRKQRERELTLAHADHKRNNPKGVGPLYKAAQQFAKRAIQKRVDHGRRRKTKAPERVVYTLGQLDLPLLHIKAMENDWRPSAPPSGTGKVYWVVLADGREVWACGKQLNDIGDPRFVAYDFDKSKRDAAKFAKAKQEEKMAALQAAQAAFAEAQRDNDMNWVQADCCGKWRRVPNALWTQIDSFGSQWYCCQNLETQYNTCAAPQEWWDENEDWVETDPASAVVLVPNQAPATSDELEADELEADDLEADDLDELDEDELDEDDDSDYEPEAAAVYDSDEDYDPNNHPGYAASDASEDGTAQSEEAWKAVVDVAASARRAAYPAAHPAAIARSESREASGKAKQAASSSSPPSGVAHANLAKLASELASEGRFSEARVCHDACAEFYALGVKQFA